LGQTVLLAGVNDDAEVLGQLLRAMVETRIKPYYLHHGDLAPGTGHFRTSIEHGQAVMREMRGRISGLCQPTYVLDIPGGHGKVPIGPNYLSQDPDQGAIVEDPDGVAHRYPTMDQGQFIPPYPAAPEPRPR
jgi:lysine 2,3-aminomutase